MCCSLSSSRAAPFRAAQLDPHAAPPGSSSPPHLRVLPWAGHKSALTLTFDDTSPSEAAEALPVLDHKGVKATFFVTVKNDFTKGFDRAWARAEREGHELGNHTVDHCRATDLGANGCGTASEEIERCNQYIESRLGAHDVYTFAYPFVDAGAAYKAVASSKFLLARAGSGGLIDASKDPDWYAMDAKFIEPSRGETVRDWNLWTDDSLAESKWLVLVFHSILPETWCDGVSKADLAAIIDHARAAGDVWLDTFVNVGAYLRAERLLESVTPVAHGGGFIWSWTLPPHFPPGRSLHVVVDRGSLAQAGRTLKPDRHGSYSVALDTGSLVWSP